MWTWVYYRENCSYSSASSTSPLPSFSSRPGEPGADNLRRWGGITAFLFFFALDANSLSLSTAVRASHDGSTSCIKLNMITALLSYPAVTFTRSSVQHTIKHVELTDKTSRCQLAYFVPVSWALPWTGGGEDPSDPSGPVFPVWTRLCGYRLFASYTTFRRRRPRQRNWDNISYQNNETTSINYMYKMKQSPLTIGINSTSKPKS